MMKTSIRSKPLVKAWLLSIEFLSVDPVSQQWDCGVTVMQWLLVGLVHWHLTCFQSFSGRFMQRLKKGDGLTDVMKSNPETEESTGFSFRREPSVLCHFAPQSRRQEVIPKHCSNACHIQQVGPQWVGVFCLGAFFVFLRKRLRPEVAPNR
jgi:hypothetical protein